MEVPRRKIFLVDDNATNLAIGKRLLKDHYEVYPIPSGAKMLELLGRVLPDLVLLDIAMPDMDGYEAIRRLKSNHRFADVPVIFLTAKGDEESELKGFSLGAVDYISKPFSPPLLMKRIENQMMILAQKQTIQHHVDHLMDLVQEKTRSILGLQSAILSTVSDLVEFRDGPTGGHVIRTQMYLEAMTRGMVVKRVYLDKISSWNMDFVFPSAQLHDVGKIAIPDTILKKPARLDPEEMAIMQTHVTVGIRALERIMRKAPDHAFLRHALHIVGTHHEKWNGTGYPAGLSGEAIPLEGRLMALADVYDALVSWRPYKETFTHEKAKEIIQENAGIHFDPVLVDIFLSVEHEFSGISQKHPHGAIL